MRCSALVLLLSLPQDDARILEWIRALDDEAVETRDKAFAALVEAGTAAEPGLRKVAEGGGAEVRARAADALRAIGWKRRYDPGPSLITIRREDAPLQEILEELRKQSATPVAFGDLEPEVAGRRISVSLEKVPLFQALEAVCRAHGRIDYSARCGWKNDDPEIRLDGEVFASCPRIVDGAVELRLKSIGSALTLRAGGREEKTTFAFEWSWEKGTRPLGGRVEIEELADDAGTSYVDRLEAVEERLSAGHVDTSIDRELTCVPPEGVTRFKILRGALVVVLPLTLQEFAFDDAPGKVGTTLESRWGKVKLAEFETGTNVVHVKVETRPEALVDRLQVVLLDREGKEVEGRGAAIGHMSEHGFLSFEYPRVEGRTPAKLVVTAEVGRRERRIPFAFRDLRFR